MRVGIHPGAHTFTASADGAPDVVWRIEIANGATYDHTFDFAEAAIKPPSPPPAAPTAPPTAPDQPEPPPDTSGETERPVPASVFVFGGLTLALAVPTAIFMVKASGDKKTYDEKNNGTLPEAEIEDLRSTVTTSNLIADVFLGVTAASLVTTGILYFPRPSEPVARSSVWTVAPAIGRTGGGATLIGRF